jgi:hypothetical protein
MTTFTRTTITSLLGLFISTSAFAHFEIGTYQGVLQDGSACSFEIQEVAFENNLRHPLNERVKMTMNFVANEVIETRHLALVDTVSGQARPKHGVLTAVLPVSSGARVFELIMNEDGPTQMIYFTDNYKNADLNERKTCMNLKYQN